MPDKILDRCLFGIGENSDETVSLICMETDDKDELSYQEVFNTYPEIIKLANLIGNIKKAQDIIDNQEKVDELLENLQQEGITDTYFDKNGVKPNSSHD